jgi:hypothetical protein
MLLIAQIETAFANVTKGNACSLRECYANDFGLDPEPFRALDVEERWQELSDDLLEDHAFALIWTDPEEGFRFLLPAFMRYALTHQGNGEFAEYHAVSQLCSNTSGSPDEIAAIHGFRSKEIKAIACFVRFFMSDESEPIELEKARRWEWLAAHV